MSKFMNYLILIKNRIFNNIIYYRIYFDVIFFYIILKSVFLCYNYIKENNNLHYEGAYYGRKNTKNSIC